MIPNAMFAANGMLIAAFSFVSTLIGTNPAVANFRGCGGLTGTDAGAGVSNSGPSFVSSITKTANAGEFLVTLAVPQGHAYRYMLHGEASVWSAQAGPGDEYHAQIADPANEGSGRTTAVTFLVTILDEAGAPVELDARRVSVFMVWKISGSGA
jgi:hypothetical protein